MAKIDYRCISADSHVNVHDKVYLEHLPARFKDRAPRIEHAPEGDVWLFEGERRMAVSLGHQAGKKFEDYQFQGGRMADTLPGGYDPAARIPDMERDGVDAQLLYSGHSFSSPDKEFDLALIQAYNDWLVEWCQYAPERFKGVIHLPMWDMDKAIEELERHAKTGVIGSAHVPSYSPTDKRYNHPDWAPFWHAFEETGIIASIHLGGRLTTTLQEEPLVMISSTTIGCAEPFAILILGGVLERHPDLKLISAETGFGWWGYFLDRMDTVYRRHRYWTQSDLPQEPSFYWHRQIWATFQEDRAGILCLPLVGEDKVMWADDYPHTDTTFPNSQKIIDEHFAGLPASARQKITCDNAGRLYGWIG